MRGARVRITKQQITTALEITGMALIVSGAALILPVAGLIVGGFALVLIGALSA